MKEREKRTLSGNGLSRRRVRRKHFAKRGIAYFLTFLMLMGSVQTVSYAEENAKEIAGRLELGEEGSASKKEEGAQPKETQSGGAQSEEALKETTERSEEAVTQETTASLDTTGESEKGAVLEETKKDESEVSSSESEQESIESEEKKKDSVEEKSEDTEEELSEEEKAKLSEEGKKEEEKAEYLDASSLAHKKGI